MKVTREYLNQLITEEINQMIENGELDEGFFDALGGAASAVGSKIAKTGAAAGPAIAGAARKGVEAIKAGISGLASSVSGFSKEIVTAAQTASTKADAVSVIGTVGESINASVSSLKEIQKRSKQLKLDYDFGPIINSLETVNKRLESARGRMGIKAPAAPAAAPKGLPAPAAKAPAAKAPAAKAPATPALKGRAAKINPSARE